MAFEFPILNKQLVGIICAKLSKSFFVQDLSKQNTNQLILKIIAQCVGAECGYFIEKIESRFAISHHYELDKDKIKKVKNENYYVFKNISQLVLRYLYLKIMVNI